MQGGRQSITVIKKYHDLLNLVKTKTVYLYPIPETATIKNVTLSMTLKLLAQEFSHLETILKNISRYSLSLYNLPLLENKPLISQPEYNERLFELLNDVVPMGARGK